MQQFSYRQHISVNINTSDVLYTLNCQGKNDYYDLLKRYEAYISQ
jgi:hypothetical protein